MNSKSNSHPKSSSFIYSTFTGKIDTTPREVFEPWPQIIKRLSKPAIRANKDGPLWSPATFKPARRKKENVKAVSLLVLDIDGGMTIDQADAKLRELGAQACIYTTHSHQRITPDHPIAEDCFRIVIRAGGPDRRNRLSAPVGMGKRFFRRQDRRRLQGRLAYVLPVGDCP